MQDNYVEAVGSAAPAPASPAAAAASVQPAQEPEPAPAPEPEPAPAPEPAAAAASHRALYDYEAQDSDELGFAVGDLIGDVTVPGEGWLEGVNITRGDGKRGMFPVSLPVCSVAPALRSNKAYSRSPLRVQDNYVEAF